jgi:DNA-binding beta-propeller fold protein YncE
VVAALPLGLSGVAALSGAGVAAAAPTAYGTQQTLPFSGISDPGGVAVDSAGDVIVVNRDNGNILELPPGATSSSQQISLPFTNLDAQDGAAVDAAGDVFVANMGSDTVVELPGGATSSSQQVTLPFTGVRGQRERSSPGGGAAGRCDAGLLRIAGDAALQRQWSRRGGGGRGG